MIDIRVYGHVHYQNLNKSAINIFFQRKQMKLNTYIFKGTLLASYNYKCKYA